VGEEALSHIDVFAAMLCIKRVMTRIQIQFPDPLYQRLKRSLRSRTRRLSEVMRKAAEHFVTRFPEDPKPKACLALPRPSDCAGDFLAADPASLRTGS